MVRSCFHLSQPPSWRTTPCRLSVTAYSIYSQVSSITLLSHTWANPIFSLDSSLITALTQTVGHLSSASCLLGLSAKQRFSALCSGAPITALVPQRQHNHCLSDNTQFRIQKAKQGTCLDNRVIYLVAGYFCCTLEH